MARCQDCNKFVGLDMQDPELESIDLQGMEVSATVRIVRCCAECGNEMKEATLDMNSEIPEGDLNGHYNTEKDEPIDGHTLSVDENECDLDQIEEGGGRYKKSFYGATVAFRVYCSCGEKEGKKGHPIYEGEMEDKVAASSMDEL